MLNRSLFIFWLPLLAIHILVLFYQSYQERWYLVDSYEYLAAAENMEENGSWYSKDREEAYDPAHHSRRTPLYPFLLMLSKGLVDHPAFVALWQIILSLFNIHLMLRTLNEWRIPRRFRFVILPFLLLLPAQYIYANLIMTEILFQTLLTAGIWIAFQALSKKQMKWFWIMSLLLMLAMLTKPVMYFFFLPYLILLGYLAFKWKKYLILLPALLPLALVLTYQGINYQRTGYFHYSSVQSLNLLQLTTYNLLINRVGEEEAVKITDDIYQDALRAPSFAQGQKLMQERCLNIMWKYKGFYLLYHLRGMVNFFLDPGRFDLYHLLGIQKVGSEAGLSRSFSEGGYRAVWDYLQRQPLGILLFLSFVFIFNLVKALGFLGFLFYKKIPISFRLALFVLVAYLAGVTGPYGASRFALPTALIVIAAAVAFYSCFWKKWERQRPLLPPK